MAIPINTLNTIALLGNYISLHTGEGGGLLGANEPTDETYARQATTWGYLTDGFQGSQVAIPCSTGEYTEYGIFSVEEGLSVSSPTNLTRTASATGGTFTADTYYWVVLATNWNGSTLPSNEVNAEIAEDGSCYLEWDAVNGATGYDILRGTTAGNENLLVGTVRGQTEFTDTGFAGEATTVPIINTARAFVGSIAFGDGPVVVNALGGPVYVTPRWKFNLE